MNLPRPVSTMRSYAAAGMFTLFAVAGCSSPSPSQSVGTNAVASSGPATTATTQRAGPTTANPTASAEASNSPNVVSGDTAATTWSITTEADKLTDQDVLTATALARVSGQRSPAYEFEMKCEGRSRRLSLAVFDDANKPREIPWRLADGHVLAPLKVRVDAASAKETVLQKDRYSNGGQFRDLFGGESISRRPDDADALMGHTDQEVVSILGPAGQRFGDSVNNRIETLTYSADTLKHPETRRVVRFSQGKVAEVTSDFEVPAALPAARLLIADLFPDETVEFSFATLTDAQRDTIRNVCFSPPQ